MTASRYTFRRLKVKYPKGGIVATRSPSFTLKSLYRTTDVPLTESGRRLVRAAMRKHRRLALSARLTARDTAGNAARSVTRKLTLVTADIVAPR